jgi:hypothetical protein
MSNELRPKPPDAAGKKHGGDTVSAARSTDWGTYLAFGPVASAEFMDGVEDLPVQERDLI